MSTDRNTPSQSSVAMRERLGQALGQTARPDLGHLIRPHALRGHPVERRRSGPVTAQSELQEPVTAQRARFDQPPHRLAVPDQRPELGVAGVGVGIEVDHRDPPGAQVLRHPGGIGPGDRVITAEDQRDRAGAGHGVHGNLQIVHRTGRVAREHLDIAGVVDAQVGQPVHPQGQGRPRAVVRQVAALADLLRTEAGTRSVRRAAVERCARG